MVRLKCRLTLKKNGRTVVDTTLRKTRELYRIVQVSNFSNGRIMVTYRPGWWNSADFTTNEQFRRVYTPMIEKELVDYVNN